MADDPNILRKAVRNPKQIIEDRLAAAERDTAPPPSAGRDAGPLPGPFQMDQATFSGYDKKKEKK